LVAFAFGARLVSALLALGMAFVVAPAVFGFYGRLQAIGLVFAVFAFLRLERAVIIAPRPSEAIRVTRAALLLLPASSLLAVGAAFGFNPDLIDHFPPPAFALLLFLSFAARGAMLLANAWLLRSGQQARLSLFVLVQAGGQFIAQSTLLATQQSPLAMLILGEIIGAVLALLAASSCHRALLVRLVRPVWSAGILLRWRKLVLFNLPAALASQTFVALPLITVGHLADYSTVGHIALALRIAEAPMQLLASGATTMMVAAGAWRGPGHARSGGRVALLYSATVVLGVFALAGIAWATAPLGIGGRVAATAVYLPMAALLTGAIALGAPCAELVAYAGAERRAFAIHLAALISGVIVFWGAASPVATLLCFSAIALGRSLALWIMLPSIVKSGNLRDAA
jgi:hypothetical protein